MFKIFINFVIVSILLINPIQGFSSTATNPSAIALRNRISNNFSNKYCKGIESGFSKDQAMRSAIIDTENIVAFSINPQKSLY